VDEQIHLMLKQLLGPADSTRLPAQPSQRVIRDLLARCLRARPLTVGEQMSAVVLLVDHTEGDMAFWESTLASRSMHVTARCAILKALTCLAEISGRPIHLTALTGDELECLVEPRLMHDAIVHLADGEFISDVLAVL